MNVCFDYNFDPYLCSKDQPRPLRSDKCLTFEHRKTRLTICKQSFFTRTMSLIDQLPKNLKFEDPQSLKERLLKYFWVQVENNFNELVSDTWKL